WSPVQIGEDFYQTFPRKWGARVGRILGGKMFPNYVFSGTQIKFGGGSGSPRAKGKIVCTLGKF
ncbi:hypothetical protein P4764_15065, partial [Listeria monocytogenes]|nr:hypothetical protein [Listeria monocytogenes]